MIVLAALTVLLPFAAAFGGLLGGPALTRALGERAVATDAPTRRGEGGPEGLTSDDATSQDLTPPEPPGSDLPGPDPAGSGLAGSDLAGSGLAGSDATRTDLTSPDLAGSDATRSDLSPVGTASEAEPSATEITIPMRAVVVPRPPVPAAPAVGSAVAEAGGRSGRDRSRWRRVSSALGVPAAFGGRAWAVRPRLPRGLRSRRFGVPAGKGPAPLRNGPALTAVVPILVATVLTVIIAITQWMSPEHRTGTLAVIPTGSWPISITFLLDGQAAAVALMVCCVALAVQVYSVAYMAGDPRYSSYAAFISLFTAAMLLVVFAGDLLVMYVGWEVMGVCSYFLIGHHWEDRANSRAAVKAFLVTRVGDVGFLLGILILGVTANSFSIDTILDQMGELPDGAALAATLLLLAGVAGKSAQFPLHTWLPDAMAGPTPISALIHAATMVAAGIYVVARLYPVFLSEPTSLAVLGVMASISMLGAALAALAQRDLKRVLAYSTISQLGYMAAGLAAGTRSGALFHLLTHGAFKALLFLAAGCVIYVTGTNLLGWMGGLRTTMPVTFWSMTVGLAALAGLPPASGFFSKDAIIEGAHRTAYADGLIGDRAVQGFSAHPPGTLEAGLPGLPPPIPGAIAWLVYLTLLLTIAVTAAYAMRAWLMVFFGEPRSDGAARTEVTGDAPPLMTWPVAVLAVPALILGFFGLGAEELRPHLGSAALSVLLVAAGAGAAYLLWNRDPALDPARALGPVRGAFEHAFFVDNAYAVLVVRPVRALARAVVRMDDGVVDAAVRGTGPGANRIAGVLRRAQNGNPQAYLTGVLAGTVLVVFAAVVVLR